MSFPPRPQPPPELSEAAKDGGLVVFVGAGVSRLVGCPSWDGFADGVLGQLVPEKLSHYELAQLRSSVDAKKRLSLAKIIAADAKVEIDYGRLLVGSPNKSAVYGHLAKFNCSFVTTNYDEHLVPAVNAMRDWRDWRFIQRGQFLSQNLDRLGSVIHLHGSVRDSDSMIISTREYLEHYASPEVQVFLVELFRRKTVLFIGYGLEEVEILEYMFRKGSARAEPVPRRYILQGFFDAEKRLCELLTVYYRENFGSVVVPFPRDHADYEQLTDILAEWAVTLKFGSLALADEIAAIEDEING
jgi:hypothetical protein